MELGENIIIVYVNQVVLRYKVMDHGNPVR